MGVSQFLFGTRVAVWSHNTESGSLHRQNKICWREKQKTWTKKIQETSRLQHLGLGSCVDTEKQDI